MFNPFSVSSRIKRVYSLPKESIYTNRFFTDLCSGFNIRLGEKDGRREFYAFEPKDCRLEKLFMEGGNHDMPYHDPAYSIGKVIEETAYDLIAFGKAYVYIEPYYKEESGKIQKESGKLSSVNIAGIRGVVNRRRTSGLQFYWIGY